MNRWVLGARPRTLPAAVVPVIVGTAVAYGADGIIIWRVLAALVTALAIQVATNYVNDYADGQRGTDDARVGPPRLVGSKLASVKQVKLAALAAGGVAAVAGLALTVAVGPQLLVVGLASFAAAYFYTGGSHPYGYHGMGEIFVFVFFGVVATVGSAYVQLEELTLLSFGASVPVGLLATSLLVVNNLRDIPGDTAVGKRTLAVRMGDEGTRSLYMALLAGAFLAVLLLALARPLAVLALLSLPLAVPPLRRIAGGARGGELIPALAGTGSLQLAFGILLSVGLVISA